MRGRGRERTTWSHVVERDMRERGLKTEDGQECEKWRELLWENRRKTIVAVVLPLKFNCLQLVTSVWSKTINLLYNALSCIYLKFGAQRSLTEKYGN